MIINNIFIITKTDDQKLQNLLCHDLQSTGTINMSEIVRCCHSDSLVFIGQVAGKEHEHTTANREIDCQKLLTLTQPTDS